MKILDPEILCRGYYGAIVGRDTVRKHLQRARQCIDDFKTYVLKRIHSAESVEEMTKDVTVRFSKGFLELFPPEDNYCLWKLLIQRTLEHFGIEMEQRR